MKPRVDTSSPHRRPHVASGGRKKRIISERNTEIQQHNKMLLGQMLKIDIGKSMKTPAQSASFNKTEVLQLKSLHGPWRYSQLTKITKDNLSLLARIRKTNSNYSCDEWKKQRANNTYMARNISENSGRVMSQPASRRSESKMDSLSRGVLNNSRDASNRPTTTPTKTAVNHIDPVLETAEERPESASVTSN